MFMKACLSVLLVLLVQASASSFEILADSQTDDVYYNQTTYTGFYQMKPMPKPLSDITATLVPGSIFNDISFGDRIYVIGGCNTTQTCYSYKVPALNNQTALTCACTGYTNACNYYDVHLNTWTSCAAAPIARYRHTAALINNKIWVTGGRTIPTDAIVTQVDVYDPLTNTWTTKDKLENINYNSDGASFASGNFWYLVGGYNQNYTSQTSMYRLDTTNSSAKWTLMAPMKFDRGDVSVQQLGTGDFYAVGGWSSSTGFCQPSNLVEKYNIASNTWVRAPDMIYARGKPALGSIGNYLFAIGGETKPGNDLTCSHSMPVPYSSRLGAKSQIWVVEQSISESLFRFAGVTFSGSTLFKVGPAIYLFGGQGIYNATSDSYNVKSTVLQYIPASTVPANSPSSNSSGLSGGAIAGIVIAVLFVVAVVGCIVYFATRNRSARKYTYDPEETSSFGVSR